MRWSFKFHPFAVVLPAAILEVFKEAPSRRRNRPELLPLRPDSVGPVGQQGGGHPAVAHGHHRVKMICNKFGLQLSA